MCLMPPLLSSWPSLLLLGRAGARLADLPLGKTFVDWPGPVPPLCSPRPLGPPISVGEAVPLLLCVGALHVYNSRLGQSLGPRVFFQAHGPRLGGVLERWAEAAQNTSLQCWPPLMGGPLWRAWVARRLATQSLQGSTRALPAVVWEGRDPAKAGARDTVSSSG